MLAVLRADGVIDRLGEDHLHPNIHEPTLAALA